MPKKRLVYSGGDMFSPVFAACLARTDLDIGLCITGAGQRAVSRMAKASAVPLAYGPINDDVADTIRKISPDIFLCAAYSHKVPVSQLAIGCAVNLHPSLLPYGRGRNPLPHLVTGNQHLAGLTLHEMNDDFDSGPILAQQAITLPEDWGYNELAAAIHVVAPRFVTRVLDDIDSLFRTRLPQQGGSSWTMPSRAERTVKWTEPVASAKERYRRFGQSGIVCPVGTAEYEIRAPITCVALEDRHPPGEVVLDDFGFWYVAAIDGVIRIPKPQYGRESAA
jgi:methionyl-tRNA formyltransferase